MKKIVFTLVALTGLLSATESVNIDNNIVRIYQNNYIAGVFKISDIAYMTQPADNRYIIVLKQPNNAIIELKNPVNQNNIGAAFASYLATTNH